MKDVVIVGLGLMGASLGLNLRAQGVRVTGIDFQQVLAQDSSQRAADVLVDSADDVACTRAFFEAELTVLTTPVSSIVELLPRVLEHSPCVTDCGSTKRGIHQAALFCEERQNFVPAHPMAGLPGGGAGNARADLYLGCTWLVCPEHSSAAALATVRRMITSVGANILEMSAEAHDQAVALTSHVPQILANVMKILAHEQGATLAAGPSFERLTRAAGGAETIWRDIFQSNGDEVARVLGDLIQRLQPLVSELAALGPSRAPAAESTEVLRLLKQARLL